jgi:hypothetical protein
MPQHPSYQPITRLHALSFTILGFWQPFTQHEIPGAYTPHVCPCGEEAAGQCHRCHIPLCIDGRYENQYPCKMSGCHQCPVLGEYGCDCSECREFDDDQSI